MRTLCALVIIIFLNGCKPYVYRPVTVKPTNFTQKHDCEFSINTFTMAEFHGAYAVTDNFAVSGTLSAGTNRDTINKKDSLGYPSSTQIDARRTRDNELSIGYFTPLGNGGMSFEVFGGMGFAHRKVSTDFKDLRNSANNRNTETIDNRYTRFFIQPSFGRNGQFVDFAFSNRFSFISYQQINRTDFISESSFTVRYGYKNVKLMTQAGFTFYPLDSPYNYLPFTFGFGIYLQFNQNMKIDGL